MKKIISILTGLAIVFVLSSVVDAQTATDSADTIREKVQEKVTQVLNSPKAYIGTVTDISSSTLQIRKYSIVDNTPNGEIQQIATTAETVTVSLGKTTKTLKFSDIAIGDFIVAMGFKNGNNVLEARRILVTEALEPAKRTVILGKVTKVMKSTLEITLAAGEKIIVEQDDEVSLVSQEGNKVTKIRFAEIEIDDLVIVVGTKDTSTFVARKIAVLITPLATPTLPPTTSATASPKASPSTRPSATPPATP